MVNIHFPNNSAENINIKCFERSLTSLLLDVSQLTSADPANYPLALIGAGERSQLQFAVSLPPESDSSGESDGGEFYSARSALFILRRQESEIMAKVHILIHVYFLP